MKVKTTKRGEENRSRLQKLMTADNGVTVGEMARKTRLSEETVRRFVSSNRPQSIHICRTEKVRNENGGYVLRYYYKWGPGEDQMDPMEILPKASDQIHSFWIKPRR